MSDVSGIPNMGFGGGNFFAPQFSYNPQMSAAQASAAYMPAVNYNQNVVNNTFASGGGFGRQTDYYSQLGANYLAQVPTSEENPFRYGGVPASLAYEGAPLSGGYTTGAANMPAFDTGPAPFGFTSGGAGTLDLSRVSNPFSGGLGSGGGGYSGPSIDWSGVGNAAANLKQDPFPGMSMPGGLGSPLGAPSGAQPFDWSTLWHGGGAREPQSQLQQPQQPQQPQPQQPVTADPYPGMAMPGGLNSPMTIPQPQSKPASVFDTSTSPISGAEFAGPFGGGLGVGGLDWGGLQGAAYQPPAEPNRYQTIGPQVTSAFDRYFDVSSPYDPRFLSQAEGRPQVVGPSAEQTAGGALTPGGGLPAADLAAQAGARLPGAMTELNPPQPTAEQMTAARDQLAKLMGGGEKAAEIQSPANDYTTFQAGTAEPAVPLPMARPAGAPDRAEPVDMSMAGRKDTLINTLGKELEAQGLHMTSSYRNPSDPLSIANPGSAHTQGRAFDVRAQTPGQADTAIAAIRELLDARGLQQGRDYRIIDEVRNPSGWATGPHVHTQFTEEGMQRYQQQAYQDPFPNAPRPPEGIPSTTIFPARPEGPVEWDPNAPRPPADIPVNDVRSDVIAPPAEAEPVPLPQARPNAAANLAQAHSVLDSNIGDLVRKNSPANVDRVPSSIASQTLREALGNAMTGGMIRSGITPYLPQLGITSADFDKAIAQGRIQPPRFGSEEASPLQAGAGTKSPDYWDIPKPNTPEWNAGIYEPMVGSGVMQRPENQTIGGAGSYADFARSGSVEDRRTEFLDRDQLAALKARGFGYTQQPEPAGAATNPLSAALGLGDLPAPRASAAGGMVRPGSIAGDAGGDLFNERFTGEPAAAAASEALIGPPSPLGVNPDIAKYYTQEPMMNENQRAAFEAFPGNFTPEDQQRQLQDDRAALAAQLEKSPDAMRRLAAMAKSEVGDVPDEQKLAFLETPFNKYASKGWDAFQTGITTGRGLASPLADPGTTGSYYQPARPGGTLQASLDAMKNDPALLAQYTDLIRKVMYGGTNLSGIATENASQGVVMGPDGYPVMTSTGPGMFGGQALNTQTLGGFAPDVPGGMEVFTRKDRPVAEHGGAGTRPLADWAYNRSPWQNFSDWYADANPAQNIPWEQLWPAR